MSLFLLAGCGSGGYSSSAGNSDPSAASPVPSVGSADPSVGNADPSVGSAALSWQSPDFNSDGTPISDLAGHTIYMSSTSGVYDFNDIVVNLPTSITTGGSPETYTVSNLGSGTYHFQVTAYNNAGFESAPSKEVQKTIQ